MRKRSRGAGDSLVGIHTCSLLPFEAQRSVIGRLMVCLTSVSKQVAGISGLFPTDPVCTAMVQWRVRFKNESGESFAPSLIHSCVAVEGIVSPGIVLSSQSDEPGRPGRVFRWRWDAGYNERERFCFWVSEVPLQGNSKRPVLQTR